MNQVIGLCLHRSIILLALTACVGCDLMKSQKKGKKEAAQKAKFSIETPNELNVVFWKVGSPQIDRKRAEERVERFIHELIILNEITKPQAKEFFDAADLWQKRKLLHVYLTALNSAVIYSTDQLKLVETANLESGNNSKWVAFQFSQIETERKFWLLITDFGEHSATEKTKGLREIKQWCLNSNEPIILTGNFGFSFDIDNGQFTNDSKVLLTDDFFWAKPDEIFEGTKVTETREADEMVSFLFFLGGKNWQKWKTVCEIVYDSKEREKASRFRPIELNILLPKNEIP